jgi:hypothetical protein
MLIGLATLISVLFFGGVNEYFLIDKLDKGAKKYVVDKERKKEITADLKDATKFIKAFNKERSNDFKSFKELNAERTTSKAEMIAFFEKVMEDRIAFQDKIIHSRIAITGKIKEGEWVSILELSKEAVAKKKEKQQKKIDKGKEEKPFKKTLASIDKYVSDSERKEKVIQAVNEFIEAQLEMINALASKNMMDDNIVANKSVSEKELKQLAEDMNKYRQIGFDNLINFHFSAKEYTSIDEWDQIMKAFNKELSITSH